MHSSTCRRQAKKIEAAQAIERRVTELIRVRDYYTSEDRKVAEELEARELLLAFLAEEK